MRVDFPYPNTAVEVPDANLIGIYSLPAHIPKDAEDVILRRALENPIGSVPLRERCRGKSTALIICDDVSRPTPAHKIIPLILDELQRGGIDDRRIEFMMAVGTHRPMTQEEIATDVRQMGLRCSCLVAQPSRPRNEFSWRARRAPPHDVVLCQIVNVTCQHKQK